MFAMMGERLRALQDKIKARALFCEECSAPIVELHAYGTCSEPCATERWNSLQI